MRSAVVVVAVAGCYHPTAPLGAPCDDETPCPIGQACVNGTCGGSEDMIDASTADTGEIDAIDAIDIDGPPDACAIAPHCVGSDIVSCNAPVTCSTGCIDSPAHCARLRPSNGFAWTDVPANPGDLSLPSGNYDFDTATGLLTQGSTTVPFPAGVANATKNGYHYIAAKTLHLASGALVRVHGGPALVLLILDDITLDAGSGIDLGGGCTSNSDPTCAGPGGYAGAKSATEPAQGPGGGQNGNNDAPEIANSESGGGGGGYGTAGGSSSGTTTGLGAGGAMNGVSTIEPLVGGSGGGLGGLAGSVVHGGRGAGGGGALQLTAGKSITIAGAIVSGGAGGESGHVNEPTTGGGGGGGGAGGAILVESIAITMSGQLAANGGGGGGNATTQSGHGQRATLACANGGAAGADSAGGAGGCNAVVPGMGGSTSDRGGGGGAVGRIRIAAPNRQVTGSTSPAPMLDNATLE